MTSLEQFISSQSSLSRRKIFDLIKAGDITVNGNVATAVTMPINPRRDLVMVKGVTVSQTVALMYYKFNKPGDVLCTMADPSGRRDLSYFMKSVPSQLVPIGRLDRHTRGLLLFTNDGSFANRVLHPKYELEKTYRVLLDKRINPEHVRRLLAGIILDDGPVQFTKAETLDRVSMLISLQEGRNRIIRRTFSFLGYDVKKLKRVAVGPVELGQVEEGEFKVLSKQEVLGIKKVLGLQG